MAQILRAFQEEREQARRGSISRLDCLLSPLQDEPSLPRPLSPPVAPSSPLTSDPPLGALDAGKNGKMEEVKKRKGRGRRREFSKAARRPLMLLAGAATSGPGQKLTLYAATPLIIRRPPLALHVKELFLVCLLYECVRWLRRGDSS